MTDQKKIYQHVAWFFDYGEGTKPGSFVSALLHAFSKADPSNFQKLSLGFPEYGKAMAMAMLGIDGGMNAIRNYLKEN